MNAKIVSRVLYRDIRGIKTEPQSDEEHLSAAIDWLFRSQDVTDNGGSAAYYNIFTGWSGPYPETSGYIVPTLYDYAEHAGSEEARERANRMAHWLLTTQLESGAFPGGVDPGPDSKPSVFNTGQILFGLTRAFRETGNDRFLDATEGAASWLIEIQHQDGYWDQFDYRGEIHSYCSRVAWVLLKVAEQTNSDPFRAGALSHLEWAASMQTETNWFKYAGFSQNELPYLHTIAYTIRGLLEGGLWLNRDDFVSAAKASADQLLKLQRQNGPLLGSYDQFWNGGDFYCLTGNAQMAIIWLRLYEWDGDKRYLEAANRELTFLKREQTLKAPSPIKGALRGSNPVWERYMRFRYPNWASKFFSDAILLKSRVNDD